MDDASPARQRSRARRALRLGTVAVSFAAGCTPYLGTTAASFLRKAREDPDPNVRYLAYESLAAPNCYEGRNERAEAVRLLVDKYEHGKEPVASRAVILRTLGALGDRAARDVVVRGVSDPEPVIRVQACRTLGKVGRAEDATVLTRVMMTDTLEDCRIAAIDALGELRPDDPRIARVLLGGMRHDDPATRLASLNALRKITKKDLGVDPEAWQRLYPDDPQTTPATPVLATAPAAPAYPPRPSPYSVPDPETQPASYPPDPTRDASRSAYPAHNPNLPPSR